MSKPFWSGGYSDYRNVDVEKVDTDNIIAKSLEKSFGIYFGTYTCPDGYRRVAMFWPGKKLCYFRDRPTVNDGVKTSILFSIDMMISEFFYSLGPSVELENAIDSMTRKDELSERTIVDIHERNVAAIPKFSTPSELKMKLDLMASPQNHENA